MNRHQKNRLNEFEAELNEISALTGLARKLITKGGFCDTFLAVVDLYPTQYEAYEILENYYKRLTGFRKYTDFKSFKVVLYRRINSKVNNVG
ncbi:MAG: hypothetical protein R3Y49_03030 [Rikenellaceae bacterium]